MFEEVAIDIVDVMEEHNDRFKSEILCKQENIVSSGDVFVLDNENIWILCKICCEKFLDIKNFANHILSLHYELNVNNSIIKTTDSPTTFSNLALFCSPTLKNQNIKSNDETVLGLQESLESEKIEQLDDKPEKHYNTRNSKKAKVKLVEIRLKKSKVNENAHGNVTNATTKKRTKIIHKCEVCEKCFSRPSKLVKHLLVHEKEKIPKVFKCGNCDEVFHERNTYRSHRLLHIKRVNCEICDKTFAGENRLREHLLTHGNDPQYKCDQCVKKFYKKASLKDHVRFVHLNIRPYVCKYCDKSFIRSTSLNIHVRIHTGEKPFVCEQCGAKYQTSSLLINHQRRHNNDRRYQCNLCEKKFFNNTYLRDHKLAVHTNEKPFQCDICQAKFNGKPALRKHKKLHSDIKQYVCEICSKAYAQSPGLYAHMKSHRIATEKYTNI